MARPPTVGAVAPVADLETANMGAMSAGEAMVSTHSRSFPGRNGSPRAAMYRASALTVAASVVTGGIAHPAAPRGHRLEVPG